MLFSFNTQHKKYFFLTNIAIFMLLFSQFNNCGKLNSLNGESSFSSMELVSLSDDGVPVNSSNPFILKCINSSDGYVVSNALKASVMPRKMINGKLSSIDWNQDEDLVATLDNVCLAKANYTDIMLKYIDFKNIQAELPFTVAVIKKESVRNLQTFIKQALASECLVATEKNKAFKINADLQDINFGLQKHLSIIGATESFLNTTFSYNGGSLYKTQVAIVDTGVDINNPDLREQIAVDSGGQMIAYNATGATSLVLDSGFHGTHVAGLVGAAYRNGISGTGVWGRNVAIIPVRVTNNGDTMKLADVAGGIIWAASRGADIINLSLGTESDSSVLKSAISYAISKNAMIVVAAGNDGRQLTNDFTQYPAMYTNQFYGLISVGSTDLENYNLSSFSNYSSSHVDILAPGSNGSIGIYSTIPTSLTADGQGFAARVTHDGKNSIIHGTSMSTPVVGGALAAVISMAKGRGITFTNQELENMLVGEGSPKNAGYSSYAFRGNYLNFQWLVNYAKVKIEEAVQAKQNSGSVTAGTLVISSQPVNKQAVVGEKVELSITLLNAPANVNYQWYKNNIKMEGVTTRTLTFGMINENNAGSYHVEATSGTSKVVSQKTNIKIALKYCNLN